VFICVIYHSPLSDFVNVAFRHCTSYPACVRSWMTSSLYSGKTNANIQCCLFCHLVSHLTTFGLLMQACVTPSSVAAPTFLYALTGIRLWSQICDHFYFELRDCLITFPIFVPSQRLIARNVHELFSFNRGVSHLNEACRIDDVSRGSLSCYEILINN
jgi:hypothetical protein